MSIEKLRQNSKNLQCFRCQIYGHIRSHCHLAQRWVDCAKDHEAKECPINKRITSKNDSAVSANGAVAHKANYR